MPGWLVNTATWLLHHRLRWVALTAAVAGLSAYAAFELKPGTLRVIVGTVALLAAVAHPVLRLSADDPASGAGLPRRIARWLMQVLLSLLALAGIIVGSAVILGRALADRVDPLAVEWFDAGLGVLIVAGSLLAFRWWRGFQVDVICVDVHHRKISWVLALATIAGLLAFLDHRSVPGELQRDQRQAREAGAGLYDLVLIVDPADPVSRELIQAARRDIAEHHDARLFTPPALNVPYHVAYGLAVPLPRHGGRSLWRLVEPPTTDAYELADSLSRISLKSGETAAPSYGRLLADLLVDARVRWRSGAQRGVAFALQDLPSVRELDAGVRGPDRVMPFATDTTKSCAEFLDHRAQPTFDPADSKQPVAWGDALAVQCHRLEDYRAWETRGRLKSERVDPPVALYALTGEVRDTRASRWWTWTRALDGRFDRPPLHVGDSGELHADAEQLLRDARDLHVGVPTGDLAYLTQVFRPHLHFDTDEKFFPLDVDWLLTKGATDDDPNKVCDHRDGKDDCEEISGPEGLTGQLDEYLNLAGGSRLGRDVAGRAGGPARMYVHVLQHGDTVYLDYWWFLRFNTSPWQAELNCLPGLTIADLSCYDHEGDWEGVTVELKLIHPDVLPEPYGLNNVIPEAVIYEAHGHRTRWRWQDVELGADPGSYATHPVVYSAAGSHASYPAGCRSKCGQALSHFNRPDGRFDGSVDWPYNAQRACERDQTDPTNHVRVGPCLLALPSTRDGRFGVLWDAFPGVWGAASCTPIAKICSLTDGPKSPSRQDRFTKPWDWRPGDYRKLAAYRRTYGAGVGDAQRRWPPAPWPPRDDTPQPATPSLTPPGRR